MRFALLLLLCGSARAEDAPRAAESCDPTLDGKAPMVSAKNPGENTRLVQVTGRASFDGKHESVELAVFLWCVGERELGRLRTDRRGRFSFWTNAVGEVRVMTLVPYWRAPRKRGVDTVDQGQALITIGSDATGRLPLPSTLDAVSYLGE